MRPTVCPISQAFITLFKVVEWALAPGSRPPRGLSIKWLIGRTLGLVAFIDTY
jgi:hypothetical protein